MEANGYLENAPLPGKEAKNKSGVVAHSHVALDETNTAPNPNQLCRLWAGKSLACGDASVRVVVVDEIRTSRTRLAGVG